MEPFKNIHDRAAQRKGGKQALASLLPEFKSAKHLGKIGDDRCLAAMTKCIFRAGFAWKVIHSKWDGFETAFVGFDPLKLEAWEEEQWEALASDTRIVRNWPKIKAVRDNVEFVLDIAEAHGSFGKYLADWPGEALVDLWAEMKRDGSRLGGMSGPIALRELGKDTFVLSNDVVALLKANRIISTDSPSSKRDLNAIQDAFNQWHEESGLPYCHMSRIASCSVDS